MLKAYRIILLIESSRASGRNLIQGIARYAHHHGPWSFFWEPAGLETARPRLKTLEAEGIILRDVGQLKEVLRLGIPAVVVGHRHKEIPGLVNVITDSATIGRMAAEHLLQCGFKHLAFCGYVSTSLEHAPWSKDRLQAFTRRIAEAGLDAPPSYLLSEPGPRWQRERRRLASWLADLPRPVGIMACNDDCGAQVMEACKLAGLAVPDAVGVIGVDNDEVVCGLADPPMTSIALNFERAGYEAAQVLERLMRKSGPVPSRIDVPATHVVARRSTDVVALEDRVLAKAVSFIRDHARSPLVVNDVAKESGLSRRALERRFRRELGGSVLDEIRRARADQIARLLLETDLPVSRIAELLGFEDLQHFARYFRATRKMSPLAFRKANRRGA
jgi:LacI family transcriptional regulator